MQGAKIFKKRSEIPRCLCLRLKWREKEKTLGIPPATFLSRTNGGLIEMGENETKAPWWFWLNILGLDAPLVACVWQEVFFRELAVGRVPLATRVALFFAMWLVYLGDRAWDAFSGREQKDWRHRWPARHPRLVAIMAGSAFVGAVTAGLMCPPRLIVGGLVMVSIVTAYFVAVHVFPGALCKPWKEGTVGVLFALGVGLGPFFLAETWGGKSEAALGLFTVMAVTNCLFVDARGQGRMWWLGFAAVLAGAVFLLPGVAGWALCVAAVLSLIISGLCQGTRAAVLMDLSLLAPAMLFLWRF